MAWKPSSANYNFHFHFASAYTAWLFRFRLGTSHSFGCTSPMMRAPTAFSEAPASSWSV